ncbi:prenyltransferase/squalene oxidase repeat-containing protein [Thalassospira xianhensis]|uniref:Squalene cyclase C-terminal domain-containing protein n=1 Tax=Thalassospira xianhensis MCCC 1A02616 TaxID=1177929 RepID=A0A367UC35_9PROT|nr:prenyltransferase/squalene oxidase repeat-containing protein [Thalassospira xianhensis]RCK05253.1 hypothetical protein TH5_15415 [Thalassospira xianhensis MCCC 1A02616]
MQGNDLIAVRDRVLAGIVHTDFAGADPFDGLESRLFRASGLGRFRMARLVWLQAIKRGPRALRHIAIIPVLQNPKTLALLLGAGDGVRLCDVAVRLCQMQNADGGWGYPFAWQARAFYVSCGASNAIVTSFVVDALMARGMSPTDPVMQRAAGFLRGLWRDGYFAYVGQGHAEIHNASLWTAWALHRIDPGNEISQKAVARVLTAQRSDGAWEYGTRAHHRFIDGFHTGYILDLLDRVRASGMVGLDDAVMRGYVFYRTECFDATGHPRSFAWRDGYLDCHAVAQAIATLCRFGELNAAQKIADWACHALFDTKRGVFYAGIGCLGVDRRNYMRWTQAWMVWALSIVIEKAAMEHTLNPLLPLTFEHPDPARPGKEEALRALSEEAFLDLFKITRIEAQKMRTSGDMEELYGLTRGLKTLQRIGGERGIILNARRIEVSTRDT